MEGDGLCPSSVNRALAVLKHCYTMVRDGYATTNPVCAVKFLKTNDERIRYLLELEEKALALAMDPDKFLLVELDIYWPAPIRTVLPALGLRQLSAEVGCIPRSKNGKAPRALGDRALEILQHLRKQTGGPWVFPSATGETHFDADNW